MAASKSVDSINDFPDSILCHILSFLPTKDAFRTSLVSKRWVSLCYSLPVLHINDRDAYGKFNAKKWLHCRRFLDAVLFSSPRAALDLTLKSFHLECLSEHWDADPHYSSYFNDWIEAAKRRNVENLDLYLLRVPLAPSVIFSCKTLVTLKLTCVRLLTMFRCPVHLPSLKTLDLDEPCFEDMEDFMLLLSGCPKLEDLKTAFVQANSGVRVGGYFKPLSNLINAHIHLFNVPFRAVYNVKLLTVIQMGIVHSNQNINSYYKDFPVFQNLTKLKLYWFRGTHDWDEVVKMLHNCLILQTLRIVKSRGSITKEDWKYPYHVPQCLSTHLTTCQIIDYEAFQSDFQFAAYILQNAGLLQVMTICPSSYLKPTEIPCFLDDLSSCPRISPTCKLSFSERY